MKDEYSNPFLCHVYHKSFVILVQCRGCKLFFIDDLYLLGRGQRLCGAIVLQISFLYANCMFAVLRVRKSIPRTTFILVSATRKISWKNQTFPSLFRGKKPTMTILKLSTEMRHIDLLSSDVSLPNAKAEFLGENGVYCINFAMAIGAAVIVMAIVAVLDIVTVMAIVTVLAIKPVMIIVTNMAIKTNMASSRSFRTWTGYWIQGMPSRVAKSSSY